MLAGWRNGLRWEEMQQAIVHGVSLAMPAIFILLTVGAVIGSWILSGTVPTLIYYGLLLLHPAVFYPAACLICALVGLAIHTFFDGVAIASGFLASTNIGFLIFFAVLLHKIPEGFTVNQTVSRIADPENGINALNALIEVFNGINALRQHVTADVRIHGVILNGGLDGLEILLARRAPSQQDGDYSTL